MAILTFDVRDEEFLISEEPGSISREVAQLVSGWFYPAGVILARVTDPESADFGKYQPLQLSVARDPTHFTPVPGTDIAAGILSRGLTDSSDSVGVIIARDAEVDGTLISAPGNSFGDQVTIYPDPDAARAALAAIGIVVRGAMTLFS